MKKKIIVLVVMLAVIVGVMSACKDTMPQTATAYGVVHQQYAGAVTIKLSKSGSTYTVDEVKIKEYLPVTEIGKVKATTTGEGEEQTTTYTLYGLTLTPQQMEADFTLNGSTYYANRIKIGDEIFTLTQMAGISGSPYVYQNAKYSNGTTYALYSQEDLPTTIKNSYENTDFTKWYIEKMTDGDFYVLKGEGSDTYDVPFTVYGNKTDLTKKQWADKELNGYWSTGSGLGWLTNIGKMETAIKTYGLDVYTGSEGKGTDGSHMLGTNVTGATLNDYHQYMGVAKKAYDDAKAKF